MFVCVYGWCCWRLGFHVNGHKQSHGGRWRSTTPGHVAPLRDFATAREGIESQNPFPLPLGKATKAGERDPLWWVNHFRGPSLTWPHLSPKLYFPFYFYGALISPPSCAIRPRTQPLQLEPHSRVRLSHHLRTKRYLLASERRKVANSKIRGDESANHRLRVQITERHVKKMTLPRVTSFIYIWVIQCELRHKRVEREPESAFIKIKNKCNISTFLIN